MSSVAQARREYVTAMTRVLVIEDDAEIGRLLRRNLTELGHVVTVATEGGAGLALAVTDEPQVVLLDLGLPDLGGQRVLEMLRGVSQVPVIIITAQDDDASVVRALDAGADDYLTKPFGTQQLAARIRAVLRRTEPGQRPAQEVRIGDLLIEPAARTVALAGNPVELSRKEYDLLWFLATRLGEVVTKRELLAEVWQLPFGGGDRTVDVHLSWLRRKLGETAAEPRYLQTVRGVGVRLVDPGTEH
jgi:two-component system, OmpR family, KDP operon response regulator KdpE